MADVDDEVPEAVPLQQAPASDLQTQKSEPDKKYEGPVPITLVTGYLGAGKTTLINHIVCGEHGFRIAVILNEFGEELGVEKAMLQQQDSAAFALQEVVELANGCLCCSVKNDFVQALEGMMQHRSKFDYILIETTGLADPGPVAAALWTDAELESGVCLDGVVTVVDARHISSQLAAVRSSGAVNEAQQQIAYADVVLLNKVDLVTSEQELLTVERRIGSLNASADVVRTKRCQVPLQQLLGRGGFAASRHTANATHSTTAAAATAATDRNETAATASDHSHTHDTDIRTVCLRTTEPIDLTRLKHWLDTLLWERDASKEDIYRMKGVVNAQGSAVQHVLQAVHEVFDIVQGPKWPQGPTRETRIVIIGRHLHEHALTKSFATCYDAQGQCW